MGCLGPREQIYRTQSPFPTSYSSLRVWLKNSGDRHWGREPRSCKVTLTPSQPSGLLSLISSLRALMLASSLSPMGDQVVCHLLGTCAGRTPSGYTSGHLATTYKTSDTGMRAPYRSLEGKEILSNLKGVCGGSERSGSSLRARLCGLQECRTLPSLSATLELGSFNYWAGLWGLYRICTHPPMGFQTSHMA